MNRNRFTIPPSSFTGDNKINPISFQNALPRFNLWNPNIQPMQNIQPVFQPIQQSKKNYCSTCDIWTVESYSSHQVSPAHVAKKSSHRMSSSHFSQNYSNNNSAQNNVGTSSSNNISNNNSNSLNNNNNNNVSNKKRYKRSNKRNNRSKQPSESELQTWTSASNVDSDIPVLTSDEKSDNKSQINENEKNSFENIVESRGQELLIAVQGEFCTLCEIFLPNRDIAIEHCRSDAHCRAYEKLLKKVEANESESTDCNKRPPESSAESMNAVSNKRVKLTTDFKDRDYRLLPPPSPSPLETAAVDKIGEWRESDRRLNDSKKFDVNARESDEIDRNSTGEFIATDFSIDFPDDVEDYDEADLLGNTDRPSPRSEKREVCVVSKNV